MGIFKSHIPHDFKVSTADAYVLTDWACTAAWTSQETKVGLAMLAPLIGIRRFNHSTIYQMTKEEEEFGVQLFGTAATASLNRGYSRWESCTRCHESLSGLSDQLDEPEMLEESAAFAGVAWVDS